MMQMPAKENELPDDVVVEDRRLEGEARKNTARLAELRWHWTLDKNNPKSVSIPEYAQRVERSHTIIARYAKAYDMVKRNGAVAAAALEDALWRVEVGPDIVQAAREVAAERGISPATAIRHHKAAIRKNRYANLSNNDEAQRQRLKDMEHDLDLCAKYAGNALATAAAMERHPVPAMDVGTARQRLGNIRKIIEDIENSLTYLVEKHEGVIDTERARELQTEDENAAAAFEQGLKAEEVPSRLLRRDGGGTEATSEDAADEAIEVGRLKPDEDERWETT